MLLIQPIAAADPALLLLLVWLLPRWGCQLHWKTHHHHQQQQLLRLQAAALQQAQVMLQLMLPPQS
jgi:hypothetical protein